MGVQVSVANSVDNSMLGDGSILVPFMKPVGVVAGTWALGFNSAYYFGMLINNNVGAANNDECYFTVMLSPGTYTLLMPSYAGADRGICKVYLDANLIATFDMYAAVAANNLYEQTAIVVTAAKLFQLRLKVDGKNGASSGYTCDPTCAIFMKTA